MVILLIVSATAIISNIIVLPDVLYVSDSAEPDIVSMPYIEISAKKGESTPASASAQATTYDASARLFGVIPVKDINIRQTETKYLRIMGSAIGIKLYSDGVMVAGICSVETHDGSVCPAQECDLREGDIIKQVDGMDIRSAYEMLMAVEQSGGKTLKLLVARSGAGDILLTLQPVYSTVDGCYRAGIWVKESASGIGILTFVDPQTNMFGGLGHAICDEQTGAVIPGTDGDLTDVLLTDITKGTQGNPGELVGFLGSQRLGTITLNSNAGVYGIYEGTDIDNAPLYRVAHKQEICEGRAQILTTLPGDKQPMLYDIVIEKINYDKTAPTRNLIISVDDPKLLKRTGGIVQGMSGSPIIQNGAVIGAVTHVCVNL